MEQCFRVYVSLRFGLETSMTPDESSQEHNGAGETKVLNLFGENNNQFYSNKLASGSLFQHQGVNKEEENEWVFCKHPRIQVLPLMWLILMGEWRNVFSITTRKIGKLVISSTVAEGTSKSPFTSSCICCGR